MMSWVTAEVQGAVYGGTPERRQISKSSPLEMIEPHRYTLWRRFKTGAPTRDMCAFIGLNPSTATAEKLDTTVTRCEHYAQAWGFAGFIMLNLFSYRATYPEDMLSHTDPSGDPENIDAIVWTAQHAGKVVCAWGNDGAHLDRSTFVKEKLQGTPLYCLKLNKTLEPLHPLYAAKKLKAQLWSPDLAPGKTLV